MSEYNDFEDEELSPMQKVVQFFWDLLKVVTISLAIIIPVRYFVIQPFYVKGASMEPSFYDHEYLIVDELTYRFHEAERGDIVVFRYPKVPSQYFIKRVVGLPGEKVEIKDKQVYIYPKEGKKFILDEKIYLADIETTGNNSWTLGPNEYYVMGDNRGESLDSRSFGPVFKDLIIGRVWLRGWPVWRAKVFSDINYNSVAVENQ
ncbi:MAG: Signal peptidase I [Parcubacteria group bacterium GW2011_GWC2_39_14]|nr:MAG: Signal peptidase I [Parcubacteria group bacterium GW2011_GWC2_39_14]KKR54925.1 MAG: Signal peptidase I [Parcubacteria group bacterium GW2011_GWA2_40_23]